MLSNSSGVNRLIAILLRPSMAILCFSLHYLWPNINIAQCSMVSSERQLVTKRGALFGALFTISLRSLCPSGTAQTKWGSLKLNKEGACACKKIHYRWPGDICANSRHNRQITRNIWQSRPECCEMSISLPVAVDPILYHPQAAP